MKRITFAGGSVVTGNAITAALLEYTTTMAAAEKGVTVDITVLEEDGETSVHTLVLSPASQFDVADVDGLTEGEEERRFPLPEMPQIGIVATMDTPSEAARTADDVNLIMGEIDQGLGQ